MCPGLCPNTLDQRRGLSEGSRKTSLYSAQLGGYRQIVLKHIRQEMEALTQKMVFRAGTLQESHVLKGCRGSQLGHALPRFVYLFYPTICLFCLNRTCYSKPIVCDVHAAHASIHLNTHKTEFLYCSDPVHRKKGNLLRSKYLPCIRWKREKCPSRNGKATALWKKGVISKRI